jgi:two-component system, response regulator / RNA-binding antiterminator
MTEAELRVLIVDQNLARGSVLEVGLRESGLTDIVVVRDMQNLLNRILEEAPDVILIDLENPNRDVLEQLFQVSRVVSRPVAMFVDRSDASAMEAAIDAGVGAYVVDGLRKERVRSIVDMAIRRYRAFERLRGELDDARRELADRKLIDRAKGILMKQRGLGEEEAWQLLRRTAMRSNQKMADVASSVITAAELFE